MSQMTTVPEWSSASGSSPSARATAARCLAAVGGSAALGLPGGLIWGEFAPRAQLQEIGAGTAELVNAETRAFIGADAWFCGIAVVAGVLAGILGYRFAMAARTGGSRALVAACLVLGAVGGGLVMLWLGGQIGLSAYNQHLASSPKGTLFPASLALGAKSALAFWPMFTAIVLLVAEWGTRPAGTPSVRPPSAGLPQRGHRQWGHRQWGHRQRGVRQPRPSPPRPPHPRDNSKEPPAGVVRAPPMAP